MNKWFQIFIFAGLFLSWGITPKSVFAEDGLPGSPTFGYGACLDLEGYQLERSIEIASNYGLDWITIDLDWNLYQGKQDIPPDWTVLDRAMTKLSTTQLSVMISITNAPPWAMDANGPDIEKTTTFITELVRRYPQNLLAIELFPAANTLNGWGTSPNPYAYAELIKAVQFSLNNQGLKHTIIAAGLEPSTNQVQTLQYLEDLYSAEATAFLSIISLRLPSITYPPQTNPEDVNSNTIRFYENVRKIMLDNEHQNGLIWVTRFDWHPEYFTQLNAQSEWLQYAYMTMRSQLYIGTASFYCLNGSSSDTSLVSTDGEASIVFNALGELIAADKNGISITQVIPSENSGVIQENQPATP